MNESVMQFLIARPFARANILGGEGYAGLGGYVDLFAYRNGTVLTAEIWGLPFSSAPCAGNIFAMHLHDGGSCSGETAFSHAGGHYNPAGCPHPAHAGDLPPLFSSRGYAWCGFYTERFTPGAVIGKTVIIHSQRDDFTSDPAGDSGKRIACGVIEAVR